MYFTHWIHCVRIEIKQINMCSYLIQVPGTFWYLQRVAFLMYLVTVLQTSSVRPIATCWCKFCLFVTVSIHVVPRIWGAQRLSTIHWYLHPFEVQDLQVHGASMWMNSMRTLHISTLDYDLLCFTCMISHHHLFHLVSTSASAISHLPVPVSAEEASSLDMAESLSGRVELYNTHLKWENIFPKAGKPYAIFRTAFERRSDCCRSRMVKARLLDMIGKLICIYCILYIYCIYYMRYVFFVFLFIELLNDDVWHESFFDDFTNSSAGRYRKWADTGQLAHSLLAGEGDTSKGTLTFKHLLQQIVDWLWSAFLDHSLEKSLGWAVQCGRPLGHSDWVMFYSCVNGFAWDWRHSAEFGSDMVIGILRE